jgi:hypothetical protein
VIAIKKEFRQSISHLVDRSSFAIELRRQPLNRFTVFDLFPAWRIYNDSGEIFAGA